jgi:Xaa-Pro aminopeptidase
MEAVADLEDLRFLGTELKRLIKPGKKVIAGPGHATFKIMDALKKAKASPVETADPCTLLKARKNTTELQGAREAQARDGGALCRFLAWLDTHGSAGSIDELTASDKLQGFRRESNLFDEASFETISGAGPNGAIVHYRVTPETNRRLLPGTLYLVDSGGQYPDGTTDVTRTVAIGEPTDAMRRHYTLVLKGHIAVATACFPSGTRGIDLDSFARRALWEAGLDYGHGTGHGVGSFLSVHEGPQSISRHGMTVLEPGMIISNEPGYYREGQYGIRLENLLAVTEPQDVEGGEIPVMGFETLTLAPFDRRLIAPELLSPGEQQWLDSYHARVWREISPALKGSERKWLKEATAPL